MYQPNGRIQHYHHVSLVVAPLEICYPHAVRKDRPIRRQGNCLRVAGMSQEVGLGLGVGSRAYDMRGWVYGDTGFKATSHAYKSSQSTLTGL